MKKKVNVTRVTKYTGITALIAIVLSTGCTSLSQYFKGWTITIKPATESTVSTDSTSEYALDSTEYSSAQSSSEGSRGPGQN